MPESVKRRGSSGPTIGATVKRSCVDMSRKGTARPVVARPRSRSCPLKPRCARTEWSAPRPRQTAPAGRRAPAGPRRAGGAFCEMSHTPAGARATDPSAACVQGREITGCAAPFRVAPFCGPPFFRRQRGTVQTPAWRVRTARDTLLVPHPGCVDSGSGLWLDSAQCGVSGASGVSAREEALLHHPPVALRKQGDRYGLTNLSAIREQVLPGAFQKPGDNVTLPADID